MMFLQKFALAKLQSPVCMLLGMYFVCGQQVQSADTPPAPAEVGAGIHYKIKLTDWSYGRERKTVTGINRVTGEINAKNSSTSPLYNVTISLNYFSGMGEKVVEKPTVKQVGTLQSGESKKVLLMAEFIPIFQNYTLSVSYTDDQKNEITEEWRASSDLSNPEPIPAGLTQGVAHIVILGQEAGLDRTGKYCGTLRVKNEGSEVAKKIKITVTYYDAKQKKLGDWSAPLGTGTLKSGEEAKIPFVAATRPRAFETCQIQLSCDDAPAEAALSGGAFTDASEVEFAYFQFKRIDTKTLAMKITAKVRNGLKTPVDQAKLTLVFYGPKKKELKRYVYEHSKELKSGEIQSLEFTIAELPAYETYEQLVGYHSLDTQPGVGAPQNTPPAPPPQPPAFKKNDDVEVIFTAAVTNEDKSVSLLGALRNGKPFAVKDVVVTVTFEMPDGTKRNVEKTLPDTAQTGEERNFPVKAADLAGYKKYTYAFKFTPLGAAVTTEPNP